jgi:hypothetical protein
LAITFAKPVHKAHQVINVKAALQEMHKPKLMLVAQSPAEAMADELIALSNKLKELEVDKINDRITEIKAELQSIAKNFPPEDAMTIKGQLGVVELTACSKSTKVEDMEGLLGYAEDKLGHEAMISLVKVTLTDLKKVLSADEIGKFSVDVAGSRSCKIKYVNSAPNAATASA